MTLAKKGAEVALQRAYKVRQEQRRRHGVVEADEDSGPLLDMDADAFIDFPCTPRGGAPKGGRGPRGVSRLIAVW